MFHAIFHDAKLCYLCADGDTWIARPNIKYAHAFATDKEARQAIKDFYYHRYGVKFTVPIEQFGNKIINRKTGKTHFFPRFEIKSVDTI